MVSETGSGTDVSLVASLLARDSDAVIDRLASPSFDPEAFLAFAYHNHLAGFLFIAMREIDQLSRLPRKVVSELEGFYEERHLCTGRGLMEEMDLLLSRLRTADIDAIFLKGPFLAQRFYGNADARLFWDIDLLVRNRKDVVRSDQLLREVGYRRRSNLIIGYHLAMHFAHEFEYERGWKKLDLHWSLGTHFSFKIDMDRLWSTKTSEVLHGKAFEVLSNEYVLVTLIVAVFNDVQRGKLRLKGFVDLYMVLAATAEDMDWPEFFERRRAEGLLTISYTILLLALNLLDCRQRFIQLASVAERGIPAVRTDRQYGCQLLEKKHHSFTNKWWTFQLYQPSLWTVLPWYIVSQPFKKAMYGR